MSATAVRAAGTREQPGAEARQILAERAAKNRMLECVLDVRLLIPEPVAAVVRALKLSGCMIYIVTAREERFRWATETWMRNNRINADALFMRPNYNSEPSKTLKAKQIVHALPVEMLARVKLIIDDREDVIESFAKLGICGLRVVMS